MSTHAETLKKFCRMHKLEHYMAKFAACRSYLITWEGMCAPPNFIRTH